MGNGNITVKSVKNGVIIADGLKMDNSAHLHFLSISLKAIWFNNLYDWPAFVSLENNVRNELALYLRFRIAS